MTYWISKTHVRIEPNEMPREEALEMARELIRELGDDHLALGRRRRNAKWTPEDDEKLKMLRTHGATIREIATKIFGGPEYVGYVRGRIKRLGLPVDDLARSHGLASYAARRASNARIPKGKREQ